MPSRALACPLASAIAMVAVAWSSPAGATLSGPDCFGYTWADNCSGCEPEIPAFGPGAQTFTAATDVVGPVDLAFVGRWYGRPVTQAWIAPPGYVTFSDQGPSESVRQFLPDPTPPNDVFVANWIDVVDADITVESTPDFLHVRWQQRWVLDPTRPWDIHLLLLADGTIRTHWPTVQGTLYMTVGHEDATGTCGRTLMQGDPDTLTIYRDEGTYPSPGSRESTCVRPPRLLDCSAPERLDCGTSLASSLPGTDATPTAAHSCDPRAWAATERVFELHVDELADVDVTVRPAAGQRLGLFEPTACDEWTCADGGTTVLTVPSVTPGDRALVVVDGEEAGADDGAFTLDVACRPLAETVTCGQVSAGTTLGGFTRVDGHRCAPGELSGPEAYYRIELAPPDNLRVDLDSATGQAVFVFDAALPLEPGLCLAGGTGGAWLPDPAPGTYILVVDGPAGSDGDFTLSVSCEPRIACDPGAAPLGCDDTLTGTTVGGASLVDAHGCSSATFTGPEAVHAFENPVRQVVTFRLDDSAEPNLDLVLLDSCNEQACLATRDRELSIELEPGTYHLVVDGRDGAAGNYTLSTSCGTGIRPDSLFVAASAGECFTEHKTVWLSPEVPPVDVLFAIDLTGSMIPERAQLPAHVIEVIERLPDVLPDVAFGLASFRDYHYPCLGRLEDPCQFIPSDFGQPGDYPYALHEPITKDRARVLAATGSLPLADLGGTSGESYNRLMHEAVHDPAVDWRPDARRVLVIFGDDLPHDCDLAGCLGGPSIQRGLDLGRDATPGTGDELPTLEVLQDLIDAGTVLLFLDSSGGQSILGITVQQFWDCWAQQTGGLAEEINEDGTLPAGLDLPALIASLVQRRQACPRLELAASPGFEGWLLSATPIYFDVELPTVAEFNIEICVPPATPPGTYEFEVQALCAGEVVAAQQVVVFVDVGCVPVVDAPPADEETCAGVPVELDASGLLLVGCTGTVEHEWREGAMTIATTPTVVVSPTATTTYDVLVTCSGDPDCELTDSVTVTTVGEFPDGVYATLRARHDGDEATFLWPAARGLLPGEHFHLLKTVDDPTTPFARVNPEGDLAREHVETDVSSPLQFFDLRVANVCEAESDDEYPPSVMR